MSFGQRLRELRRDLDLSQAMLADRAGCSVNTIRKLESDDRRPSRQLAGQLATVFDLPRRERAEFERLARGTRSVGRASLPSPLTRLIGREGELVAIRERLLSPGVRLLTLVGPPGVGKTRLALQVATELQEEFRDGAVFVALAPIPDHATVVDAIARILGVRTIGTQPIETAVVDHLRERQLLLVLDNFEHVLLAREPVAHLLVAAPRLAVLVTSREPLSIYGEHIYSVPALSLPPAARRTTANTPRRSASETLFLERARAARPNFATAPADQQLVAEVCLRLEGIPLAIELAAARTRAMTPAALLAELSQRLDVLSAGPTDFAPRQRSMRGALDWSFDLLQPAERWLVGRVAVFAGGATSDAIVGVCSGSPLSGSELTRTIESLADKSLLAMTESANSVRYGMLEVIREYTLERFVDAEGPLAVESVRRAHAEYFATLADSVPAGLRGPNQQEWISTLEVDYANLRHALDWSLANRAAELAGKLAAGLWPYWRLRSSFHEGRRSLAATLAFGNELPPARRAAVLNGAGVLAILQADYDSAVSLLEQARGLFIELGDQRGVAFALSNLGWAAHDRDDAQQAERLFEESLCIRRAIGDTWGEASSVNNLGMIAGGRDDWRRAAALFETSARLARQVGDLMSLAQALTNQGWAVQLLGDYTHATLLFSESLALTQRFQDARGVANNLACLALMALYRAEYTQARDLYSESLSAFDQLDEKRGVAESLEGLAAVAGVQARPRDAARLLGAAATIRGSVGAPLLAGDRARYDSAVAVARGQLDEASWTAAWLEGTTAAQASDIARLAT